ncbi:MAG: acyl-CoA dehydrogenase family protein [Candidatus Marinimicrobia bacterium]|jgi:alkylation response protein AidB-like acyl-CoA dehydrogenase|nr:acyl-CoA dehydrogenase family protein [Candidatus Neomarinimicrobiota bacterium]MDP6836535.1 acyl-CoA dehydrogenase family protein [Candidatus Neomarinimicrobiota bacterium]|tara:strand:- start:2930 stop:4099 length:1170 start_codon:yes stop_codon:yes gene_type:complete
MNDLFLTEEQIMLRDMVRDFAANEVAPVAEELDRDSRFPEEIVTKMVDLGLMGIPIPEQYGGAGMDHVAYATAVYEMGKVCASTAITIAAHTSLGTTPILLVGNEEQKKKYLPPLASGETIGAFGLTEPEAGSDAGATKTTAVLHGNEWVINGGKIFTTNAGVAGILTITAVVIEDGEQKGIGAFIIETDNPGLRIGPAEKKMGWKASDTRQLFFEDLRIAKDNLLGSPKEGFKTFLKTLTGGRISVGALSVGTAEGAYEAALKYSHEREAFGKQIHKFQSVGFKLANMATDIEAAKLLVYQAAKRYDRGENTIKEAAMAKLFASETAVRTTTEAIQVFGGYGYIKDYPVERYFRDAKVLTIGEGTSEVQRLVILREILKSIDKGASAA